MMGINLEVGIEFGIKKLREIINLFFLRLRKSYFFIVIKLSLSFLCYLFVIYLCYFVLYIYYDTRWRDCEDEFSKGKIILVVMHVGFRMS